MSDDISAARQSPGPNGFRRYATPHWIPGTSRWAVDAWHRPIISTATRSIFAAFCSRWPSRRLLGGVTLCSIHSSAVVRRR